MPEAFYVFSVQPWNYRALADQKTATTYAAVTAARRNYIDLLVNPLTGTIPSWNLISYPTVRVGGVDRVITGGWVYANHAWKRFFTRTAPVAPVGTQTAPTPATVVSKPPTSPVRGAVDHHSATFSWQAAAGAVLYRISRDGVDIGSTVGTSYTDTVLVPGASHSYGVAAVYPDGTVSTVMAVGTATVGTPAAAARSGSTVVVLRPVRAGSFLTDGTVIAQVGQGWYMEPTSTMTGFIDYGPPELIDAEVAMATGSKAATIASVDDVRLRMRASINTGMLDRMFTLHFSGSPDPVGSTRPVAGAVVDDVPSHGGESDMDIALPTVGPAILSKTVRTIVLTDDTQDGWMMFNGIGSPDWSCILEVVVDYTVPAVNAAAGSWR